MSGKLVWEVQREIPMDGMLVKTWGIYSCEFVILVSFLHIELSQVQPLGSNFWGGSSSAFFIPRHWGVISSCNEGINLAHWLICHIVGFNTYEKSWSIRTNNSLRDRYVDIPQKREWTRFFLTENKQDYYQRLYSFVRIHFHLIFVTKRVFGCLLRKIIPYNSTIGLTAKNFTLSRRSWHHSSLSSVPSSSSSTFTVSNLRSKPTSFFQLIYP